MRTIHVELGDRAYPIHIGRELDRGLLDTVIAGRPAVAMVDEQVEALHSARLDALLGSRPRLIVPSGEGSKSLETVEQIGRELLSRGLGRDGVLLAVGGGVTGDLCGFMAASYQRGIAFIQVPTTLLAQVDSSVGGKVAVNLPGAKNSIGFFLQPELVFADMAFLDTLPRREMAAGLAELLKMAVILDPDLLVELEIAGEGLLDPADPRLQAAIGRSCELKAWVVGQDEKESGLREILNFGHTLAHALEGTDPKPDLLHGEAVGIGMLAALSLGNAIGVGEKGWEPRLERILERWGLPLCPPISLEAKTLRSVMDSDKKRRQEGLRFVLLEDWGRARHGVVVPESVLLETLEEFLA